VSYEIRNENIYVVIALC